MDHLQATSRTHAAQAVIDAATAGLAIRHGRSRSAPSLPGGEDPMTDPRHVACREGSVEIPSAEEDSFREVFYSHVGGFDQRWTSDDDHCSSDQDVGAVALRRSRPLGRSGARRRGIVWALL